MQISRTYKFSGIYFYLSLFIYIPCRNEINKQAQSSSHCYSYDKRVASDVERFNKLRLITEAIRTKRKIRKVSTTTDKDFIIIDVQREVYRNQWLKLLRVAWADEFIQGIFSENPMSTEVSDSAHGFHFICQSLGSILFKTLLFSLDHLRIVEIENDEEYSEFDLPIVKATG
jgi:hypothetical protein